MMGSFHCNFFLKIKSVDNSSYVSFAGYNNTMQHHSDTWEEADGLTAIGQMGVQPV